jgi:hypothetical protein
MSLSDEQNEVYEAMICSGVSETCCVGTAGTGKSFTAKQAIKTLRKQQVNVVCMAPTKRTARALGGCTIASFLGLRPRVVMRKFAYDEMFAETDATRMHESIESLDDSDAEGLCALFDGCTTLKKREPEPPGTYDDDGDEDSFMRPEKDESWVPIFQAYVARRIVDADVLFVDEMFMLTPFRCEQLYHIVHKYKDAAGRRMPRFVVLGDPWQTEPFTSKRTYEESLPGKFSFRAPWFQRAFGDDLSGSGGVFELFDVKRSSQAEYHQLLANLRNNKALPDKDVERWRLLSASGDNGSNLHSPALPRSEAGKPVPVALLGHRRPPQDNEWNKRKCTAEAWPCKPHFDDRVDGCGSLQHEDYEQIIEGSPPASGKLTDRVRLTVGTLVRGTSGANRDQRVEDARVLSLQTDRVEVETLHGEMLSITRAEEVSCEDGKIVGLRRQFALTTIGGGLTTHSTQGMTFDFPHAVYVEEPFLWSRNMVFTALSRSTSLGLIALCGSMAKISNTVHSELLAFQEKLDRRREKRNKTNEAQPAALPLPVEQKTPPPPPKLKPTCPSKSGTYTSVENERFLAVLNIHGPPTNANKNGHDALQAFRAVLPQRSARSLQSHMNAFLKEEGGTWKPKPANSGKRKRV